MTIDINEPILSNDIIVPWGPVDDIRLVIPQQYSENVFSCSFDGAIDTWNSAPPRQSYVDWIPTTDVRLTACVCNLANLGGTASDTVTFEITSAAQGILATIVADVTADASSPTLFRTYAYTVVGGSERLFSTGVTTINSGDSVRIAVKSTTSTTAIDKVRLHLVYEAFWSAQ
jgi:hypothetical protein